MSWDTFYPATDSGLPVWEEIEQQCVAWQSSDAIVYAGESVDRFVFVKDKNSSEVVEVRVPSLRLNLTAHI